MNILITGDGGSFTAGSVVNGGKGGDASIFGGYGGDTYATSGGAVGGFGGDIEIKGGLAGDTAVVIVGTTGGKGGTVSLKGGVGGYGYARGYGGDVVIHAGPIYSGSYTDSYRGHIFLGTTQDSTGTFRGQTLLRKR